MRTTQLEIATWAEFKAICLANKQLDLQYTEDNITYEIYAFDSAIWHTIVLKGTADATDFEDNFKSDANQLAVQHVRLVDVGKNPINLDNPLPTRLFDANGNPVSVTLDDGKYRMEIQGKVFTAPPPPPDDAYPVQIAADDPLSVSGTDDSEYTITTGRRFVLQQVLAGAAGDPTERGSCVEVFYRDGASYKIMQRLYVMGFSVNLVFPDLAETRDGTPLTGTGTTQIVVRRRRLSGQKQEVDAVVIGYEVDL